MITLTLNGVVREVEAPDDMPLLWALRDVLGLTGTKYGCGLGLCGACTLHLNGEPIRACITAIGAVAGQRIDTIEAMANDPVGRVVQQAWLEEGVPQCGFCQCGQVMSATALLRQNPAPDDAAIEAAMVGNICRCGTYNRIKAAIHTAAAQVKGGGR